MVKAMSAMAMKMAKAMKAKKARGLKQEIQIECQNLIILKDFICKLLGDFHCQQEHLDALIAALED